eukprot:1107828-Pelagomonas_calceolata.AAC.2
MATTQMIQSIPQITNWPPPKQSKASHKSLTGHHPNNPRHPTNHQVATTLNTGACRCSSSAS